MSAPFRELFLELPRALFETLQGIGEEAVERARSPVPVPSRKYEWERHWYQDISVLAALCKRYGWSGIVICRSPTTSDLVISGRARCGHLRRAALTEHQAALLDTGELLDAIDDAVTCADRECMCVERPS